MPRSTASTREREENGEPLLRQSAQCRSGHAQAAILGRSRPAAGWTARSTNWLATTCPARPIGSVCGKPANGDSTYRTRCGSAAASAEIDDYIAFWDEERRKLPFATDGVVVKVNRYARPAARAGLRRPRRPAGPWPSSSRPSRRSPNGSKASTSRWDAPGAVTPVANLAPVQLAGTTVKRATLHNAEQIAQFDIRRRRQGLRREGRRDHPQDHGRRFRGSARPTAVPSNTSPSVRSAARRWCVTRAKRSTIAPIRTTAEPQILGRIIHFIRRKAMDIDGLGEETVELLYRQRSGARRRRPLRPAGRTARLSAPAWARNRPRTSCESIRRSSLGALSARAVRTGHPIRRGNHGQIPGGTLPHVGCRDARHARRVDRSRRGGAARSPMPFIDYFADAEQPDGSSSGCATRGCKSEAAAQSPRIGKCWQARVSSSRAGSPVHSRDELKELIEAARR